VATPISKPVTKIETRWALQRVACFEAAGGGRVPVGATPSEAPREAASGDSAGGPYPSHCRVNVMEKGTRPCPGSGMALPELPAGLSQDLFDVRTSGFLVRRIRRLTGTARPWMGGDGAGQKMHEPLEVLKQKI
jgi:hypothetical protein